ncbi:MAG TPA: MopE-related protein, partial [Kofleriaceae bacterium]
MGGRFACVIAIAWAVGCGNPARDAVDADVVDTGVDGPPKQFGDPCTHHTECESGYCIEPAGGAGGECSRTCNDDCPTGWDCLPVDFPDGVNVRVCVPAKGRLCALCATDDECPGGSCLSIDNSTRCATTCASQANCPDGYVCAADPTTSHAGMYCLPVTASCTCAAENAGITRTCVATNGNGTCTGTQMCETTGWSACTAPPPSAEVCDGLDNDCNFVIDNDVGGGEACTNTNGFGSCPGVRTCNGSAGFVCNGQVPTAEKCNSLDDNCNGSIDETFAGLGTLCNAGVGACLRYGTVRCNTLGTGTECSAVMGTPTAEACNQIDDNCNGSVDETFTTLGMQCTAGVGVCTRYGTNVCKADGTAAECSAVPGTPTSTTDACNYLDDNCDGIVDNGFRDPLTGLYTTDTNCGACGNDCTTAITAPNASGACVVSGTTAGCGLRCNAGAFDLNASTPDGCEFVLDTSAIHVSTNDLTALDDAGCGLGPTGTGAGNHPCKT